MAMVPSEPDWAGLPEELLDLIYDKLKSVSDHVRFSAVCLSWQSMAAHNQNQQLHNKTCIIPPLLMIPTKDNSKKKRSLYSVTQGKVCDFQLSVPYNRRCCGSSHRWLVFYTKTFALTLFNPFLNKTIHLPRLETPGPMMDDKRCFEIVKVVLSADPDIEENYVVASAYSDCRRLAFFKAGDKSWTYIKEDNPRPFHVHDVIFHRGRILAVTNRRMIVSVDVFNNQLKIITPGDRGGRFGHVYLVKSCTGDVLLVQRTYYSSDWTLKHGCDKYEFMTEKFDVYKLVLDDQTGMVVDMIDMKSLGEETLFLGDNSSMSVLASKYDGLKQNSIYYTDDYTTYPNRGPRDIGMFSLEDRSIHQHYPPNPSQNHMPPPIWIVPTLRNSVVIPK